MPARTLLFVLGLLMALLIPVQMTIGQTATAVGLRLNAADAVMPFAVLTGLYLRLRHHTIPAFRVPYLPFWLVGLTGVILMAFLHGYAIYGVVSSWSLINRVIGWLILIGYFATGAIIMTFLSSSQRTRILAVFVTGIWATILLCSLAIVFGPGPDAMTLRPFLYPLQGFMGDRNAFALTAIMAFILSFELARAHPHHRGFQHLRLIIVITTPAYAYLNYSLSGMIVLLLIFLIYLLRASWPDRKVLMAAVMTGLIVLAATVQIFYQPKSGFNIVHRLNVIGQAAVVPDTRLYSSDHLRLETYTQALTLWSDRPVLGIGLGGFMMVRDQNHQSLAVLDSTPIWILTEMGLIGFIAFLAFGGVVTRTLAHRIPEQDNLSAALTRSGLMIILAFVLMSAVLQLLYIRPLWLIMGMVLTRTKNY